jgi:hypothetical protein
VDLERPVNTPFLFYEFGGKAFKEKKLYDATTPSHYKSTILSLPLRVFLAVCFADYSLQVLGYAALKS